MQMKMRLKNGIMSRMVGKELQDFAAAHKTFWWWVKDPRALSEESIVEGTLNCGSWDDVQELIRIMGMDHAAEAFYRDIGVSPRRRGNYHRKTLKYFLDYFERHAPSAYA